MSSCPAPKNHQSYQSAIKQFEIQAINFGYRFINDAGVRASYMEKTAAYAESLRSTVATGEISPREAAQMAQEMRNEIMEWARTKTSDYGRAKAKQLKTKGVDMEYLLNKYSKKLQNTPFDELSSANKNSVYMAIVDSSGRPNPKVSSKVARLSKAGRGLWLISLGVATYNIASAEDKERATGREIASVGGGFAGGAAAGALAGIWAGPIGVAVGVAVGGLIGSIISDQVYIEATSSKIAGVNRLIDRHTSVVSVDEEGIASALIKEGGYQMDLVLDVFKELDWAYSTDADDVALLYVKKLQSASPQIKLAFKQHKRLRNLLVAILEDGWTSKDEQLAIAYVKGL